MMYNVFAILQRVAPSCRARVKHLWKLKTIVTCAEFYIYLMTKGGSVYIMTNKLNNLIHLCNCRFTNQGLATDAFKERFPDKYNLEYCGYYENFFSIGEAILREKQLKKWSRVKKENLINSANLNWIDLWLEVEKW
jgi:putative endonuclease